MIGFIDTLPQAEPYKGCFLLTLGDQQFLLTRHAFEGLYRQSCKARSMRHVEDLYSDEKVIPFPKPKHRRKQP